MKFCSIEAFINAKTLLLEHRLRQDLHRLGGASAPAEPAVRIRLSCRRGIGSGSSGPVHGQPDSSPRMFRSGRARFEPRNGYLHVMR